LLEIKILGSKNSPYPFDPDQMERMQIGKKFELARH
jgi:hypothetical protein